jgi:hypothetical protein
MPTCNFAGSSTAAAAVATAVLNLACALLFLLHADLQAIAERMASVKNKLLVLSGKGGVGKSTFATQLAFALAAQGKEVRPCMHTAGLAGTCVGHAASSRPSKTAVLLCVTQQHGTSAVNCFFE